MADSTTAKIDKFFDALDSGIDNFGKVLGRVEKSTTKSVNGQRAEAIDAHASEVGRGDPTAGTALAVSRFKIIEATDAETGMPVFIVTNGAVKAECSSREMAEKVRRAVEQGQ